MGADGRRRSIAVLGAEAALDLARQAARRAGPCLRRIGAPGVAKRGPLVAKVARAARPPSGVGADIRQRVIRATQACPSVSPRKEQAAACNLGAKTALAPPGEASKREAKHIRHLRPPRVGVGAPRRCVVALTPRFSARSKAPAVGEVVIIAAADVGDAVGVGVVLPRMLVPKAAKVPDLVGAELSASRVKGIRTAAAAIAGRSKPLKVGMVVSAPRPARVTEAPSAADLSASHVHRPALGPRGPSRPSIHRPARVPGTSSMDIAEIAKVGPARPAARPRLVGARALPTRMEAVADAAPHTGQVSVLGPVGRPLAASSGAGLPPL